MSWYRRISPPATIAARISAIPQTAALAIPSPIAPTAARDTPSSTTFRMTATRPPWPGSACAPSARPSTTTPPAAASTPNRMPAQCAVLLSPSCPIRRAGLRPKSSPKPSVCWRPAEFSPSKAWADFTSRATPKTKWPSASFASGSGAATNRSASWLPTSQPSSSSATSARPIATLC